MITLEGTTQSIFYTKGLFSIPIQAFQFDWEKLNRIFLLTFHKYESFCPRLATLQTGGGNPIIMPEDCIYPRAIGFGNSLMIAPQSVCVQSNGWSYDRATRQLSVFTNTGSSASFKVQYLARYPQIEIVPNIDPYEVFDGEEEVSMQLPCVPDLATLQISKGASDLKLIKRDRDYAQFEGSLGAAILDMHSLELKISQEDTSAGVIDISCVGKYKGFDIIRDDEDFFVSWFAANILTSLGNIKAVLKLDEMPNDISADDLISQGKDLMSNVIEWQKEKSAWYRAYMGARV